MSNRQRKSVSIMVVWEYLRSVLVTVFYHNIVFDPSDTRTRIWRHAAFQDGFPSNRLTKFVVEQFHNRFVWKKMLKLNILKLKQETQKSEIYISLKGTHDRVVILNVNKTSYIYFVFYVKFTSNTSDMVLYVAVDLITWITYQTLFWIR